MTTKGGAPNQQGPVYCWSPKNQPEMQISHIAAQMGWHDAKHVGLELTLINYDSPWINELYDSRERHTIHLYAHRIEGTLNDFTYSGWRVPGHRVGDKMAAMGQEPEWFEIHVLRGTPESHMESEVQATWRRIAPLK